MGAGRLPSGALSLKRFVLRGEVLALYRELLRSVRQIPDENRRKELKDWIRGDFRCNKHHQDEIIIKTLLAHGRQFLKELNSIILLSRFEDFLLSMATKEDAELEELVIQTLESNGVLAKIKAQLRASVFLALEDVNTEQITKSFGNNEFKNYLSTEKGKLVASLVYDFLRHFKLESTLSVYQAESQFGHLYSEEDLKPLLSKFNISSSESENASLINTLVTKCHEMPYDKNKQAFHPVDVPLKSLEINKENPLSETEISVGIQGIVKLVSDKIDSDPSSVATLTDKSSSDRINRSSANKNNFSVTESNSKQLEMNNRDSIADGVKPSSFSLSSLNDAPPLTGIKGQLPQLNYTNNRQRFNEIQKQSGDNEDYEDDFQSSLSLNSAMKSDLNNSIEEEIEENISGNMDEIFSYEGGSDGECVTSDRTVSHISNTGIDQLESIG